MAVSLVRPDKDGGIACEARQRWRHRFRALDRGSNGLVMDR